MRKAKSILLFAVTALLMFPAAGASIDLCSDLTQALTDEELLALLQAAPAPAEAQSELTDLRAGNVVPKTTSCTKEQCSAARAECREWCPFPCTMVFECKTPSCGSCISCTC